MKRFPRKCIVELGVMLGLFSPIEPVVSAEDDFSREDVSPPSLTLGALYTDDYWEGIGDLVIPVYYNGTGLFFVNPRASSTDESAQEYNFGLGYRHLVNDRQAVMGGNLYYDHRETAAGASFGQVGFGAEFLSHYFDLRANVYFPTDSRKKVNEYTMVEEASSRSVGRTTVLEWHDPYATGHSVVQPYEETTTTRMRTTTTSTTRLFHEYEVALRGWDVEAGVPLPLARLEGYARLKAFAGYYKYYGRHGVKDVDGFRGRLEMHLRPAFLIDATYYSNRDLTGGNVTVGAYVSVPFDLVELANGRNPFAAASELWDVRKRGGDMSYRLTEMVKRDPQIRARMTAPEEQTERTSTTTQSTTSTSTSKAAGESQLVDNMTFVDGDNAGDSDQNGTYENPYATIDQGVQAANSPVWVFDAADPYSENVVVPGGVHLYGNGTTLVGHGGKQWGGGAYPVVLAPDPGPVVHVLGHNTVVSGFDLRHSGADGLVSHPITGHDITYAGIYGSQITDFTLNDNLMTDGSLRYGIFLSNDGTIPGGIANMKGQLLNNRILNTSGFGLYINGRGVGSSASGSLAILTAQDTHEQNGGGIFEVNISGDYSMNQGIGIAIDARNYERSLAFFHDVNANNNGNFGISTYLDGYDFAGIIAQDVVTDRNRHGFNAVATAVGPHGRAAVMMDSVQANSNQSWGLYYAYAESVHDEGGLSMVMLTQVTANYNRYGMDIYSDAFGTDAMALIFAADLEASYNTRDGIAVIGASSMQGDVFVDVRNVSVQHNEWDGIYRVFAESFGGDAAVYLSDLDVNSNGENGIGLINATSLDGYGAPMFLDLAGDDGMTFQEASGGAGNVSIDLNDINASGNGYSGIADVVAAAGNGEATVTIMDVEATANEGYGICCVEATAGGENSDATIKLKNVDLTDNASGGYYMLTSEALNGGDAIIIETNVRP